MEDSRIFLNLLELLVKVSGSYLNIYFNKMRLKLFNKSKPLRNETFISNNKENTDIRIDNQLRGYWNDAKAPRV